MENVSNIGNLFAFSHDPVVYVEDGIIAYMNPPALDLFGRSKLGLKEQALLPDYILDITSESFVASVKIENQIVTVSRTSFMNQKLYSFILPNPHDDEIIIHSVSACMRELTNGIKTNSDLITALSHSYEDPILIQYSAVLKHYSAKMKRLVNNYTLFSAFRQGTQSFNPVMLSIGNICKTICEEVEAYSLPHNIALSFSCENDIIASVDQELLYQMILNLVSNSLNHMPDGGKVQLTLSSNRNNIVISVEDNGVGMSSEVLCNVFKSYTTPIDLSMGGFNAGLGLVVSDYVAKMHGGTLIIESKEKIGTKVIIQIPRVIDTRLMSPRAEYKVPMREYILTELSTWLTWEDYLMHK